MKKFNKISVIDTVKITETAKLSIQILSHKPVIYPKVDAKDSTEVIERIGDADAVLGNWESTINTSILEATPNLKYIGICGSSLANIDIEAVNNKNIVLKNVVDYGDEGVAEYIFAQLLNLFRGFGKHQWRGEACELNSKTIGIVGLGATGQQVARVALGFKMNVLYFSTTRKPEWEAKGLTYASLQELFKQSDIISLHVPKNTKIIGKNELDKIGNGKIITDTCLGNVYKDVNAVRQWLKKDNNFLIRDHQPETYKELGGLENFIYTDGVIAGLTIEARERLSQKVVNNIIRYLQEH
jgi:lactate dehydrogenase-like 2-hydroxyacid dehydrogenase